MRELIRPALTLLTFALVAVVEYRIVMSWLPPASYFTSEKVNELLLISMGFAFLPIFVAVLLAVIAVAVMSLLACAPAYACWKLMSTEPRTGPTPRERSLRRLEELRKMTPERNQKHVQRKDV